MKKWELKVNRNNEDKFISNNSIVVFGTTLLLAIILFVSLAIYVGNIAKEDSMYEASLTENFIYNSSKQLLVKEGVYATSAQVYNQTWLDFDGNSNLINTSNKDILKYNPDEVTICINFITQKTGYQGLVGNRNNGSDTNWTNLLLLNDNRLSFGCKNLTTEIAVVSNSQYMRNIPTYFIKENQRYTVCGKRQSNGYFILYLNGYYMAERIDSINCSLYNPYDIIIGSYYDFIPIRSFNGSIYSVHIYNRSLSNYEVEKLSKGVTYDRGEVTNNVSLFRSTALGTPLINVGEGTPYNYTIREIGNILYNEKGDGTYKWVYTMYGGTYYENNTCIGWANSSDGITWTNQGKLIGSCGMSINNVTDAMEDPYVIYNGSHYFLYAEDKSFYPFKNITLWTSTDFKTWTKYGPKVLGVGATGTWDAQDVSSPALLYEDGVFYMLYEGRNGSKQQGAIGIATSTDGYIFTKHPENPIISPTSESWDKISNVPDSLIKYEDKYYIYYHTTSFHYGEGLAITTDLLNKSKYQKLDHPINRLSTSHDLMIFNDNGIYKYVINDGQVGKNYTIGKMYTEVANYTPISAKGLQLEYKLNENTGTTAYDSSGNGINGTIRGATWQNDGVLVNLKNGVDYSVNKFGVFTILNPVYMYNYILLSYDYKKIFGFHVSILELISGFLTIVILGIAIIYVSKYIQNLKEVE